MPREVKFLIYKNCFCRKFLRTSGAYTLHINIFRVFLQTTFLFVKLRADFLSPSVRLFCELIGLSPLPRPTRSHDLAPCPARVRPMCPPRVVPCVRPVSVPCVRLSGVAACPAVGAWPGVCSRAVGGRPGGRHACLHSATGSRNGEVSARQPEGW